MVKRSRAGRSVVLLFRESESFLIHQVKVCRFLETCSYKKMEERDMCAASDGA